MICEVYLFRQEEALLHADAEISYSFNFLSFLSVANGKLRKPNTVDILFIIFHDIVEYDIQKNK